MSRMRQDDEAGHMTNTLTRSRGKGIEIRGLVGPTMQEPASILNPDENDLNATQGQDHQRRRGPLKFAYASGSQPLDGYTIKRGIGVGGFGDVYYAHSDGGKEVALKRIQRNLDVEIRGVKQCLNLKHPNLLDLYDIRYDEQDQAWVVMEYVAGESLQDVIERNPNGMPEDEVARWFHGIAKGVDYLHDHGIVHRDLKPGNIFIDQDIVKIGDYGLAKFISCSRRSGQTESVGTFHYMAPEIGLGRYGKEIDVYALGILLFEMLTGHVPFEGESSQEIIMKHLTAQPDLNRVKPRYRQIIGKALAKDPADRFQSVGEMAKALGLGDGSHSNHAAKPQLTQPVMAQVIQEEAEPQEPIAKFVMSQAEEFKSWWRNAEANSPWQIAVLVVAVVFLLLSASWLLPLAFTVGVGYAAYYLVWSMIQSSSSSQSKPVVAELVNKPDPKPPISPQRKRKRRTITKQFLHERYRDWLSTKPLLAHASELTGSMLMSVIVSVVMSILLLVIGSQNLQASFIGWGPMFAWLTITSVAGSWGILLLSKFWEGHTGDHALRRFCMLATGLFVGAFAGVLSHFLLLEPSYLAGLHGTDTPMGSLPALYDATGSPRLLAYMGYFGVLFLLLRWWLNADPLRSSRFGIFSTIVTVLIAMLLHAALPIPRGFMVAATIAVAVQLSAPWVSNRQRKQLKQEILAEQSLKDGRQPA